MYVGTWRTFQVYSQLSPSLRMREGIKSKPTYLDNTVQLCWAAQQFYKLERNKKEPNDENEAV